MSKGEHDFAGPIVAAAVQVAKAVGARVLFAYVNAVEDLNALRSAIKPPTRLVLICRDSNDEQRAVEAGGEAMMVPAFDLTRMA